MHPIFRSRQRLFAHLAVWAVGALFLAGLLRLEGTPNWAMALGLAFPLMLLYAFVCLTPWYTCRGLPLASTAPWRVVTNHVGAGVLATALWIGAARLLGQALQMADRVSPQVPLLIAMGFFLYGLSVALHYMLLAVEASRDSAIQAREAELRALKAQINPHFLFNSLNSIAALTASDPAKARQMCIGLSGFLRKTLGLGERENISWSEEMQLARMYLDVEQIRFGRRLQVEMSSGDGCASCQVPPLLFQPLIENAIKHGIATLVEGGTIRVESRVEGDALVASVENSFDPDSPPSRPSGLGLRNVRNRLETRFGGAGHLVIHAQNSIFRAVLSVPCRRPE